MLIFGVKIYWQYLSLIQSHEVKKEAFAISCKVKHLIHHPWITMMYSSYRAVQAQEEDETYLMEDNHQSATIPVHHRQQTNKQKQKQKEKNNRQTNKQQKKKKKNKFIWLKTITNQRPSLSITDNKQISKNKSKKKKSNRQTNKQQKRRKRTKLSDWRQSPISDHPSPSTTTNK